MEINTKRLRLIPLTLSQLSLLLNNRDELEKQLGVPGIPLDETTGIAMEILYKEASQDEEEYIWYTNWQIILKSDNISIGSACFKGPPSGAGGEVEIGYGINEAFRNNGYMKEAAKALCKWALKQADVLNVTAETDRNNPASQRVLIACGMTKFKETEESYFWRIKNKDLNALLI